MRKMIAGTAALAFLMGAAVPALRAEDSPKTVKNYKGLQFKVPEDWPIVKVGDSIGPIPVEDYVSRKFKETGERLKKQEEALAALEKRVEQMERRKPRGLNGQKEQEV